MSKFTFDVFISYSHEDAVWVKTWLLPRLEAAGLRVCIDSRDFAIGAPSVVNMETAVRESARTLLVLTPAWVQSEWTNFEALLIQTKDPAGTNRRLLPLLLKPCEPPDRLAIFTHADFTDPADWDLELNRLLVAIRPAAPDQTATLQPHLVHTYAIQANFTGRVRERGELTAWPADDERPVCALVAMGGMGKSALAWYWLTHDLLPGAAVPAVDGVMWWSFYEGESSFARFIHEALRYVGGRPIDPEQFPTTYDRAQELRRLLQTRRVLFVLDGFERQLRAYAGLDAAYRPDHAADPSRDARSCVDPTASRLLRDIAAGATRAKLLLTTRLMPSDLEDRAGDPLAGVLNRELKEMSREDALAFMDAQGVKKGTPAEIATACAAYGYHPLSLRLLSGLIARDARTPGDIAAAPRHDVHADLIQRQHHVLEHSYNALPKRERALLSRIAAFRGPMDYEALSVFNTLSSEERFQAALEDLRARGLLQRDLALNRYDLHPIVRRYAYDRLSDKKRVHTRLRDYFTQISVPHVSNVRSIEDLMPVIELYHHTTRAGQYDEAATLLRDRLVPNPLYFQFGAYQLMIELIRALFLDGEGHLPRLKNMSARAWLQNALAISYGSSGQPRRAAFLFELSNIPDEKLGNKEGIATTLQNMTIMRVMLGELAAAERDVRRCIKLSREINNEFSEFAGHQELGRVLAYRGAFVETKAELKIAQDGFDAHGARITNYVSVIRAAKAQCALIMGDIDTALRAAREAQEMAREVARITMHVERDFITAEWLLGEALVMEGRNLNAAAEHLGEALARCRRINLVEIEPNILLGWARWFRAHGNAHESQTHAEEALAIADRCEYRLAQAEIRNFLAWAALEAGEREVARAHAEVARERAWCDGPPYCYRVALDEAEGMLRELGVGEEK
ncbi:MAG TPA: TIR domain-containing protein [Pyrinomonadaceae bacterium]